MLTALTIANIVLVERLAIEFAPGFSALTGETGAGKSILLDALGLALGARADAGLVRQGAEQAAVTATFDLPETNPALQLLREQELEADRTLILRRTLTADGRSKAFVNDQPVGVALLKQLGSLLVEIHGQFDTQGLLDPSTHPALLDAYAGLNSEPLAVAWRGWRDAERALTDAREQAARARAEEDFLRASVADLETLTPRIGEEAQLSALRTRLMKRTQLLESLAAASEGTGAAEGALNGIWRAVERLGEDGRAIAAGMERSLAELRETMAQMDRLSDELQDSEHDLPSTDDRLYALRREARKHNCAPEELPAMLDTLRRRLSLIERQEEVLDELKTNVANSRAAYIKAADTAGAQRKAAAVKLDKLVAKELPPLKLEKARFETSVIRLDESAWGPAGADTVQFLVATNPGAAPGALDRIASGGEMARFMLALKVVMAAVGSAPTLVFDEVDTGIGGATAAAVGERLAALATSHQVLVVTHAPQVAARARHHWQVVKSGTRAMATTIVPLDDSERREEIARMLAGSEITAEARAAADKLLQPSARDEPRKRTRA